MMVPLGKKTLQGEHMCYVSNSATHTLKHIVNRRDGLETH